MRLLILFLLFLFIVAPVKAEVTLNLSANFIEPVGLPSGTTQLLVNLTLVSNETGDNLLVIDVIYDTNSGWEYLNYSASMNGKQITFDVFENDVDVFGSLKHRVTFSTNLTTIPVQPEVLTLKVDLRAPNVNASSYPMDVIAMWSFPASNAVEIKKQIVVFSQGEINPDGINDTLEQIVSKYNSSFDWTTQTPTPQIVFDAIVNAVDAYFKASDPAKQQEIFDDIIQMVDLYFKL